ncbi:MAG: universal stress protein, partial [Bacteroidetes bacterium]|nr:universal stress protein [Bacteroidota bacterium]
VAVALEFGENDNKLLSYAIGQVGKESTLILIHVVESASAKFLGKESDDLETRKDQERLNFYIEQLKEKGISAEGFLGFKDRAKEISSIVKQSKADMLVIGAHGHTGIKDWIYGETINTVRHELKVPVLVVYL